MVLCYKVILNNVNMTIRAQTLQNLNAVQYIRWNIKREGFCEIYNVRPLAILAEEGSHSNAALNKNPTKRCPCQNGTVSKQRLYVTCHTGHTPVSNLSHKLSIQHPNVTQCVFCIIRLNLVTN